MAAVSKRDDRDSRNDRWLFGAVIVFAVAEVLLAAVRLAADVHALDLVHRRAREELFSYDLAGSLGTLGNAVAIPEAVVGLVLVVVLLSWRSKLVRLGATGPRRRQLARTRSFRIWRVVIVIWLVQVLFLSSSLTIGTVVQQATGLLNRDVAFQILRLAVAGLSVWCAFTLREAARRLPAPDRTAGLTDPVA